MTIATQILNLLVEIDFMCSFRNIILDLFRAWLEKDLKKYFLAVLSYIGDEHTICWTKKLILLETGTLTDWEDMINILYCSGLVNYQ